MVQTSKLPIKRETAAPTQMERGWDSLERMRREMDRLFDEFRGGLPSFASPFGMSEMEPFWKGMPRGLDLTVDFAESPDFFKLTAELPGMNESNVEVKVANGNLVISGEKKDEFEEKKPNYFLSERRYGSFERVVPIPDGTDTTKIDATLRNGLLTVTLPKSDEAKKETKIAIKAA